MPAAAEPVRYPETVEHLKSIFGPEVVDAAFEDGTLVKKFEQECGHYENNGSKTR